MYIAGNISDFQSRLHQLPSTTGEVDSFVTEGNVYINSGVTIVSLQTSGKWETEARRRYWNFSNNPNYLNINRFGASFLMVSDNFNSYADGTILTGNWAAPSASEVLMATSGQAAYPTAFDHHTYAIWTGNIFSNNQYSQDKIIGIGPWNGVIARDTLATDRFYMAFVFGANDYRFYLRNSGAYANLATYSNQTWVSGDTLKMSVVGYNPTFLYMYRNDVLIASLVDTLYNITGGSPGIGIYNPTNFTLRVDDWVGGNTTDPTSSATITSDNFQRANSDTLGLNWINGFTMTADSSPVDSPRGIKILNNAATAVATPGQNSIATVAAQFNTNHSSTVTVGANVDGSDWQGPFVRSNFSSYYLVIVLGVPNGAVNLYALSTLGGYQVLQSNITTANSGDRITLQASGTNPVSLTLLKNDVPVYSGNEAIFLLTGNRIGFAVNFLANNASCSAWSGGNL